VSEYSNGFESWAVGRVLFIVPTIRDSMNPKLKSALDRRRRATLTGTCDCGARRKIVDHRHGGGARMQMAHEADCPAGDTVLAPLLRAGGTVA
jgi:hypothetical protein